MKKRRKKGQEGTVFVTTLVAFFMMSLIGSSIFSLTSQDMHYVHHLEKSMQAQSLAEAGLAEAFATLRANWASSATYGPTTLDNGSYTTTVSTIGGRTRVLSVGTVDGVSRTARAEVTPPGISALDYVFASGGDADIDSGTANSPGSITGDIYTGGNLTLDGPSNGGSLTLTGDIDTAGNISASGTTSITGTQTPSFSQAVTFPTVDFNYYKAIAQANGTYYSSDQTYTSGTLPAAPAGGVIYVEGNITISGTQNSDVCLVASGNISVVKSGSTYPRVTLDAPIQSGTVKYPAIVAGGNISFTTTGNASPDSYLNVSGLVYAQGNFNVSTGNHTNITVTGQILARGDIDVSPTAFTLNNATYDPNMAPPGMDLGTSTMTVESYTL